MNADPDYEQELAKLAPKEFPLLSITSAIRKNPQRIRVCGIIDSVRKLIKLTTKL